LERICGIDLTQVVGLNVLNVLLIVSEIGVDMSKWRSAKAFCSWLDLCPGNKISGGKLLDSRTRQVVNRVADALRLAAQSAGRTQTCLGIFYRRKQAHLGAPKATTATARKLACLIYHLLKNKQPYQEPDSASYQLRLQKSALSKLQRQPVAKLFWVAAQSSGKASRVRTWRACSKRRIACSRLSARSPRMRFT